MIISWRLLMWDSLMSFCLVIWNMRQLMKHRPKEAAHWQPLSHLTSVSVFGPDHQETSFLDWSSEWSHYMCSESNWSEDRLTSVLSHLVELNRRLLCIAVVAKHRHQLCVCVCVGESVCHTVHSRLPPYCMCVSQNIDASLLLLLSCGLAQHENSSPRVSSCC